MKKIILFFIANLVCILTVSAGALDDFLNNKSIKYANVGLLLKNLTDNQIVWEYNSEKLCVPYSTTKLLTTAVALEKLGADFQYKTILAYDGTIVKGTLKGNLYIIGGGDPTIGSEYINDTLFLQNWADAVRKIGIKKINGSVIADASLYGNMGISPKWLWEDVATNYAAATYGLSIFDNLCDVTFQTKNVGDTATIISTSPSDLSIDCYVTASEKNKDNTYFYGAPLSEKRSVYGTLPANREEFTCKIDIPNPPLTLAQYFSDFLSANDITVIKKPQVIFKKDESVALKNIATFVSPTLSEILKIVNIYSNNHYAEHVYRSLSIDENFDVTDPFSSSYIVKDFFGKKGWNTNMAFVYDGCGLSPQNQIAPKFLVDILEYEYKSAENERFISLLPVAGESGTIKYFLANTPLEKKVYAKSGSAGCAQNYAGYINLDGKTYAFAIMVSYFSGSRKDLVKAIENLLLQTFLFNK